MKHIFRPVCLILTLVMLLSVIPALRVSAQDAVIGYTFANALAGDGEGTVALTGLSGGGYCSLYFTDGSSVLDGYEPIAVKAESGTTASVSLPRAFLIPAQATGIALFESGNKTPESLELSEASALYDIPAGKRLNAVSPSLTFASVSDAHLNYDDNGYGASAKWKAALNFFDEKGMDYVILSGDITSSGGTTDYERYIAASAASTFPFEKIYEAQGNHDATQVARFLSYTSGAGEDHPFSGSAWFSVLLEGAEGERDNLFIFMAQELSSTSGTPTTDNFSTRQLDWVEGLLQTYAGTQTNIFIVEHAMIRNFGPGDKYNGVYVEPMYFSDSFPGNMRFKSLLTEYKEAVMMSGHTHLSFYDGYNYGDEKGTAARMIHNSSTSQPRCYSGSSISYNSNGKTTATAGSEGYLVYVYDEAVCYVGYNLTTREAIPTASYMIPLYSEDRSAAVSISVTTQPTKTVYESGEWFDGAGMVVTATYSDGSTAEVKGWGCSNVGSLKPTDTSVQITYGSCAAITVPITVNGGALDVELEGSGTAEDPFLIGTADDFAYLTAQFNASTNQNEPFGTGLYYKQTADIDMTGYAGYEGTHANGNAKCYFGGVYDGGGHVLTVNVTSTGQTSVFPYIYGAILNLTIKGSINSDTSAQPIRTAQAGSVIANCVFEMTLTSSLANGVCYSSYGTLLNVYVSGVASNAVYNTNSGGKYYHVFTNVVNASGTPRTHSTTTASSDLDAIAEAFNNREDAAFTAGVAALTMKCPDLGEAALGEVTVKNGELVLSGGEIGGGNVPELSGSGTVDDPYVIDSPEAFKILTDFFNSTSSESTAYGKDCYFVQTADIDMTGFEDYTGTRANGNAKCFFGGVYDGGGHTLTVNIDWDETGSSNGQTSVFPYITGAILNLKFAGSIDSPYSAQPIRTVQGSAVVANCLFDMTLSSSAANGVSYSVYGTLYNVYVTGVAVKAVYNTNSNGSYHHVFTNVVNASGSPVTHSTTVASSDLDAIAEAFNNREDEAFTSGAAALAAVSAALTPDLLQPVHSNGEAIVFGEPEFARGDVNRDGFVNIDDVTFLLNRLSEGIGDEFDLTGNGLLTIQDVTVLLNILIGVSV